MILARGPDGKLTYGTPLVCLAEGIFVPQGSPVSKSTGNLLMCEPGDPMDQDLPGLWCILKCSGPGPAGWIIVRIHPAYAPFSFRFGQAPGEVTGQSGGIV